MSEEAPKTIDITSKDIPITCPPEKAKWNLHPRVYIPVADHESQVSCPYCGTTYVITDRADSKQESVVS